MATSSRTFRDATRIRRAAGSGAALIFAAAGLLLTAGVASAHDPAASLTCVDSSPVLTITIANYSPGVTNTVAAKVDGKSVLDATTFASSYSTQIAAGDATVGHTATVNVTAGDDPTGSNGWTRQFALSVDPCQDAPSQGLPSQGLPSQGLPSHGPSTVPSSQPTGGVEAATATPRVTLPATSTGATPSGPTGAGFPITLAVLIGLALWALLFAPEQVVSRLRRRRR